MKLNRLLATILCSALIIGSLNYSILADEELPPEHTHNYTYTIKEDGTHDKNCEGMEDVISEAHTFVEGVCVCGETENTSYLATGHSLSYVANNDGTHNVVCNIDSCEEHNKDNVTCDTNEDLVCSFCGAELELGYVMTMSSDIMFDTEPPVIKGLELDKTYVEVPGDISLTVEAVDNLSNIDEIQVEFENDEEQGIYFNVRYPENETTVITRSLSNPAVTGSYYKPYSGTYKLSSIKLTDAVGNTVVYSKNTFIGPSPSGYDYRLIPDEFANLSFSVKDESNVTIDTEPPVIKGLELDKTYVEVPGDISLTVKAVDNLSNIDEIQVGFENDEEQGIYFNVRYPENETTVITRSLSNPTVAGSYYRPYSGTYKLSSIKLTDAVGNVVVYSKNTFIGPSPSGYDYKLIPDEFANLSFSVKDESNVTIDTEPPVIKGLELDKTYVEVPGDISLTVKAVDNLSNIDEIQVGFENDEEQGIYFNVRYPENETTVITRSLSNPAVTGSYYKPYSGTYKLSSIKLTDAVGNTVVYSKNTFIGPSPSGYDYKLIPGELRNWGFFVENDVKGLNKVISTADSSFVDKINNAESDSVMAVDYSLDGNIPREVFDCIENTNKTIYFTGKSVQWKFKGSDIIGNNNKPLDLSVEVNNIDELSGSVANGIEQLNSGRPTTVLHFSSGNGVLPGKATIRLKVDRILKQYLGTKGLDVFFYDQTGNKLVPIATNISVTPDEFIEFEIFHCSYYVILGNEPLAEGDLFYNYKSSQNQADMCIENNSFEMSYNNSFETRYNNVRTVAVSSTLPHFTISCSENGIAYDFKALTTSDRDKINQAIYANYCAGQKRLKVQILDTKDIYAPYNVAEAWKKAPRIMSWKNTGAKAGDLFYVVWYCQEAHDMRFIPAVVSVGGTVYFAVPCTGSVSTMSIVKCTQ